MDPNSEIKRTKGTRYVNADWSDYSRTKKSGLQEVAVETVVYADGRVKEFILDGSGNRFPDPVRQDFDEDQRKAWDAQKKDQPPEVNTPASKRTAREEEEIAANAALPADQDPASETNAERKARADRVIKEQGAAARQAQIDADTKKRQQEQDARQATLDAEAKAERERVAARQATLDAQAAAEKNRPTVKIEDDGQGGLVAISVDPNTGKPTSVPVPGVKGKPQQVTVAGVVYEKGPDGTYKPLAGLPTGALPAGAPRPSGVLGDAAKDMDDFMAWLDPQVRSGAMTQAQADQHVKNRQGWWDTVIKEKEAVLSAQGQSFRDQSAQRRDTLADLSNRRTSATSIANQASGELMPYASKLGANAGGVNLGEAIRQARFNAQDFVTMTGANREVAPVQQGAAVQAVNAMPLPGGTAMAPGFNPRGNAIGAGAVGAGVAATNAAAINPTGPNVEAANQAVQAGSQAAFGALGVGPQAAPATPAPIFRPPPPVSGSVAPPVGMLPATPPGFLSASRARPQAPYDPTSTIQAMIADPSINNQMLRAAVAAEYPGYDVDALLASAA